MFKSWTPTFYINLMGSYVIDVGQDRFAVNYDQDILILRNSIVKRYNQPLDRIFTVKFYPGGLEAVLGLDQTVMLDQVIPLERILPASLLISIKTASSFHERINAMEAFLLTAMHGKKKTDHYLNIVFQAIGEYAATGMQLSTTEVAERLFITSKSINRYFNRVVGVSPKKYFSILRARTALTAMVADKEAFRPWDHGYYDPAHFYKEVHAFTGRKLREQL